ncbi:MAG: hypothetical protein ACOH2A_08800 [Sphingobacteriaceae bacterium]
MKLNFYKSLITLVIIALAVSSCKKDNNDKITDDLTAVIESTLATDLSADLFVQLSAIASENRSNFEASAKVKTSLKSKPFDSPSSCAAITISPAGKSFPKTVTLDFGTGCTFNDVVHKGKITAVFSAPLTKKNATITVKLTDYYYNDTAFEGILTVVNNGLNTNKHLNFNFNIVKANINNPDFEVIWESSVKVEWVKGQLTNTSLDDEFAIKGSTSGTTGKGEVFTAAIIKPLVKKASCRYITEGTVEYQVASNAAQIINYGMGECDNQATVSINGNVTPITLRK